MGSTLFEERERSYENKFAHDQELEFKIAARTNKLLAIWAAEQMNMHESEQLQYALDTVEAGLKLKGSWNVIDKVATDLRSKNVSVAESEIQEKQQELAVLARQQVMNEGV